MPLAASAGTSIRGTSGVVYPLEEYCSTVCVHGETTGSLSTAIAIVRLGSFILVDDVRHELRVYRSEYVCKTSPGAPSETADDTWDAFYDGDFDNVN